MQLPEQRLEERLAQLTGEPVDILSVEPLGDAQVPSRIRRKFRETNGHGSAESLKTFGYGEPVLISYSAAGEQHRVVLNTAAPNHFGHEHRADRAAEMILAYDTYGRIPKHVQALDVGVVMADERLLSLADSGEFYILSEYVAGQPYAHDLQRLRDGAELSETDVARARALAAYLARLHANKRDEPPLYFRHLRDTIGGGEGIMGLTDNYPATFELAPPEWLEEIEKACVRWRWQLKSRPRRCSLLHGDFHPFNILFESGDEFHALDRSRALWGEPADDVTCMTINYLFFSLQRSGALTAPFDRLWHTFWETYLDISGDGELLAAVAPFFVWRALVLASPTWYNVDTNVRQTLLDFAVNLLNSEQFDPGRMEQYLDSAPNSA
jgi:hypothetical protein